MKPSAKQCSGGCHQPSRRGNALLEFAIVLPLLMLIIIGCVDFARFLYIFAAVTNAAEEGATYGSVNPPTANGWQAEVTAAALAEPSGLLPMLAAADVSVTDTISNDPAVPGHVTVEVQYPFSMAVPGIFQHWGLPITFMLRRTVVMPHTR